MHESAHMRIKLDLVNTTKFKMPPRRFFVLTAKSVFRVIPRRGFGRAASFEIGLIFVSSDEVRALNKTHRGKNKPTDVLSFPRWEAAGQRVRSGRFLGKILPMRDPDGVVRLGEIVMAPNVVRKEASLFHHTLYEHHRFLFIHGLLHLFGYDHERSKKEEREMFNLQQRIFEWLMAS